jgi:hypothetical protein
VLGEESDEAALALADQTRAEPAARHLCVASMEAAATDATYSNPAPSSGGGRTSLNVRCDGAFAGGWRAVLSNRFDYFWAHGNSAQAINSLKEAYASFQPGPTQLLDFGRINVRQGVAFAYNPTDYFRADANRTVISIDPQTLREERLGALMARYQVFWPSGSFSALFAPRVDAQPNASTFSPDFGATNARSRWLLAWSQRLPADFQPQLSLSGAEGESPQAGLDLTRLVNRATVAYLEWSGGRSASNVALSGYGPAQPGDTAFRSRLSTGLTYTTSYKLSITLEYQYNEAAPSEAEWTALRSGPVPPYVRYRQYAAMRGEIATRQNWFGFAHWDDLGINHLGLTAFVRFDPYERSHLTWVEARYHWQHAGIALQWQRGAGDAKSDFAPWPERQSWLAVFDYYF